MDNEYKIGEKVIYKVKGKNEVYWGEILEENKDNYKFKLCYPHSRKVKIPKNKINHIEKYNFGEPEPESCNERKPKLKSKLKRSSSKKSRSKKSNQSSNYSLDKLFASDNSSKKKSKKKRKKEKCPSSLHPEPPCPDDMEVPEKRECCYKKKSKKKGGSRKTKKRRNTKRNFRKRRTKRKR